MNLVSHPILRTPPGGTVNIDLRRGRLSVRDVKAPQMTVDRLTMQLADPAVLSDLFDASSLDEARRVLQDAPVDVRRLQIRIPQETLTRRMREVEPQNDPEIRLFEPNGFEMSGHVERWVDVPFAFKGTLEASPEGRLLADVHDATVFGVLPAMMPVCAAVAARLARRHVSHERDGGRFDVDVSSPLPQGARFRLGDVHVEGTDLVIGGTATWRPIPNLDRCDEDVFFDA